MFADWKGIRHRNYCGQTTKKCCKKSISKGAMSRGNFRTSNSSPMKLNCAKKQFFVEFDDKRITSWSRKLDWQHCRIISVDDLCRQKLAGEAPYGVLPQPINLVVAKLLGMCKIEWKCFLTARYVFKTDFVIVDSHYSSSCRSKRS